MKRAHSLIGLTAATIAFVGGGLRAQETIDQAERRFERPEAPLSKGSRTIPQLDPLAPPPEASAFTFRLNKIELLGNTAFSEAELRPLFASLLGTDISVGQLFAIANSVTAYYGQRGFPLSRAVVPAQEIDGSGVVLLQIVEGYVDQAEVEGPGRGNRVILRHAEALSSERPISNRTLERHLLLADDLPGTSVKSVLREGASTGATTVILQTEDEPPFRIGFTVDNRGSEAVGPLQFDARLSFANLIAENSETQLRFVTANVSKELIYLTLDQEFVLGASGTELNLGIKKSASEPGTQAFKDIELETGAITAFATLTHPVIRSRSMNLAVYGTVEARNSETLSLGVPLSRDRVRSLRLGLNFDNTDTFGGLNTVGLELSKGLNGLGASNNGDTLLTRQSGLVDYGKFTLDVSRTQQLGVLFPNLSAWSVHGELTGQMTGDPLLSSEECSLGGNDFGRAFDSSTVSGDRCVAGSLEVRYSLANSGVFDSLQFFGFYEGGSVSNLDPSAAVGRESLVSAGLGARFGFMDRFSGAIELADQVHNGAGATESSPQIFLSVSGEF